MRLLKEWLSSNTNRAYPFANATVSNHINNSVFVDMLMQVVGLGNASICIDRLVGDNDKVSVFFAILSSEGKKQFANAVVLPKVSNDFNTTEFTITTADKLTVLSGEITTGHSDAFNAIDSVVEFTGSSGVIYSGCVLKSDGLFTRILIDNVVASNDIDFVAGDGIDIIPSINEDGTARIEFKATAYKDIEDNNDIMSDSELLSVISSQYRPVTSINGVRPDRNGNIDLYTVNNEDTEESNGVAHKYVVANTVGEGVIALTVPGMLVCDEDVSNYTQTVTDNIAALNERAGQLYAFCTSLETTLTFINTHLAQVK